MKKAKIVASIVLAAAMGTTMFAAACGKEEEPVEDVGKEFVISEYAHSLNSPYVEENKKDFSETSYVHKARESMGQLVYDTFTYDESSDFAVATVKTTTTDPDTHVESTKTTYTLYNVKTESKVFEGYQSIQRFSEAFEYFKLTKETDEGNVYQYVGPDGKLLPIKNFTNDDYRFFGSSGYTNITVALKNYYVDEDDNTFIFYTVTYKEAILDEEDEPTGDYEDVVKYFCMKVDEDGEFTFSSVNKEEDTETPDFESEYPAGSVLEPERKPLSDEDSYPNSNWKGIEVLVEGATSKTYTFYKKDAQISSVVTYNPEYVCYVGNYMYYYEVEAVSFDAKEGYNYEYTYSGTTYKANYTLYRFDFVNGGEAEEVETQYIVTSFEGELFNNSRDSFDKIAVSAIKKENGVAVNNPNSKAYLLVLDDEFKVSVDLSAKDVTDTEIIRLQPGSYLVGNKIVNDYLDTLVQIPDGFHNNITIWEDEGLLVCEGYYGTMFVDFYGRVVIEPHQGTLNFFGRTAYNSYDEKIYSENHASGIELEDLVGKGENTFREREGLIVKTYDYEQSWYVNDQNPSRDVRTLYIYSPSGSLLGAIDNMNPDYSVSYNVVGGKIIVRAYVYTDNEGWTSKATYWIIK